MADLWFYAIANEQKGPVSIGEIQKIVKGGQAGAEDLAWREGMTQWTPIGNISELAIFLPAKPLPTQTALAPAPTPHRGPPASLSADDLPYAGFWIRALAYLIDCLICVIPVCTVAVIVLAMAGYASSEQTPEQTASMAPLWICMLVGLLVQWPYWALMESSRLQATLGKKAMGIIVIDANGNRLSFARASGRYFARVVAAIPFYVGLLMVAFDGQKRGLHDRIAGTYVIKKAFRRA